MFFSRALGTVVLIAATTALSAESPMLAKLQGKWSGKRTASDGQEVTQTIEIKGDKLVFQLFNADKELRFVAKGSVKAEMLGPFSVLKITDIQAGRSADETEPVNDDRTTVYLLSGQTLTLASNFDKERENQRPSADRYERVEAAKEAAPTGKLPGKWKVVVKMGEDDRDYEMNLVETGSNFSGVLISPRSGEHKFKSVTFTNGKLTMELPRDIEGNEVTFLYTGELKGSELSGDVVVKGYEDQFKGTWKATR
jgi:hypothetical protein